MTTWLPRWFALLLLEIPFVPVVAVDPDDKEIERLVKQLDSDKFKERQEATKRLAEIGEPALDALGKAKDTLEVRRRAEAIIEAVESRLLLRAPRHFESHAKGYQEICSVALSPDGRLALSGGNHAMILWDVQSGEELRRFTGHTKAVLSVAFSPDGRQLVSGSEDKTVRLWDVGDGRELRRLEGHSDLITGVAFSPCGRRVLSCSHDKTLRLWDAATGKELRRLAGRTAYVWGVALFPDGRRALSCAGSLDARFKPIDCTVRLWDLETGRELRRFEGHRDGVMAVAVAPDGKRIISGGSHNDKTVRLWDVETGKELHRFAEPREVTSVAFAPDGRLLLSGGYDGGMRLRGVPK